MQVDAPAESRGRCCWRSAVGIDAGRVRAFARVVIEVKLYGHALADSGRARRSIRAISESATRRTKRRRAGVLDRKRHAISIRRRELECEIIGEGLHVYGRAEPATARFSDAAIRQAQTSAIEDCLAVKYQTSGREARTKVNSGRYSGNGECRGAGDGPGGCGNGGALSRGSGGGEPRRSESGAGGIGGSPRHHGSEVLGAVI